MARAALLSLCSLLLPAAGAAAGDAVATWLAWIERSEALIERVHGYTVVFHKKELLGNSRFTDESLRLKFMKPFHVYMEWTNPKGRGGEAIYVDGWNRNRIHVHPGGFWGLLKFNLDPMSRWVVRDNRHPVTQIGLHYVVGLIGENVRRGVQAGEFTGVDHGASAMFGRNAIALEGLLPTDPGKGYYCRRVIVHAEAESGLLLNLRVYDWDDRLVEEYGYEDFREVALTAADFDPSNPSYRF